MTVTPFKEMLGQKAQLTLWLLMGAAGFVLIIACANVTNLTLMRGVRREHELTVRAALGAGATRLRKLLLVENMILAGAGRGARPLDCLPGVRMLSTFAARYITRADEISVDGLVLAFTLGLAVVVAIVSRSRRALRKRRLARAAVLTAGAGDRRVEARTAAAGARRRAGGGFGDPAHGRRTSHTDDAAALGGRQRRDDGSHADDGSAARFHRRATVKTRATTSKCNRESRRCRACRAWEWDR